MKYKFIGGSESNWEFFPDMSREFYNKFMENRDDDNAFLDIILKTKNITKADILEYFAFTVLSWTSNFARTETDEMMIKTPKLDKLMDKFSTNSPAPTYISEYIGVIGELFLGGLIDFGTICDMKDFKKIEYDTNLSHYGTSKYEAWVYFRDNFFYKNAFNRHYIDDDDNAIVKYFDDTSWIEPQNWSQYNVWVCRTPKGVEYYEKILSPKIYAKYKDVEINIDEAS
ncbi:hypothetical protein OFO12_00875 [Campylobacter sp. JMF_04 NA10]|uniref:hypothetical protein n=1 Tax=Campylobacter sp. JMF_04 NA10 TaxID=2983824 RepID=UPI0022E9CF45|nr:hypothetical protein [Campylobacter sp. JMF_04 NA10]MDA3075921.1 hypothetical protein [Campylobacter sp. JMF_04 NA10]